MERLPLPRIAAVGMLFFCLVCQSVAAESRFSRQVNFDIAAQSVEAALLEFSRQADVQVMVGTLSLNGQKTDGVKGKLSVTAALEQLLKNTGLEYEARGNTITVRSIKNARADATVMPLVDGVRLASNNAAAGEVASTREPEESARLLGVGTLDEVVVTGTNIRGVVPESSPLSIYTADDIRGSGATTVEQFIQRLPQNHGGTFATAPQSTGAFNPESATGIDLRGLGIGTTLVLINGRRLALAASGRAADVSMIPLGAVERVEVLSDGASGIYGADAVGGVVNFVLKDEFEGAQTALGYGSVTSGGLSEMRIEQTLGRDWNSGRGLVSYYYLDRESLDASERDFAQAAAPYTLAPADRRNSALFSGQQDGPAGIKFFGDALLSSRDTRSFTSHFAGASTSLAKSEEEQFFVDVGGRKALSDSVAGEIVASYSTLTTDYSDSGSFLGVATSQVSNFEHSVVDVTGKLDGDLFDLLGGATKFSAGGGYTSERYAQEISVDGIGRPPLRLTRNTKYIFGELFVPLLSPKNRVAMAERIEISLSARYTDYSDFGAETSPRIGLLWAPASFVSLRATYSESFRAPSLVQLNPATSQNVIFQLSAFGFPDPFSNDGSTMLLLPQGVSSDGLGPERAKTYTAGIDLQPQGVPGFKMSGTYFRIKYRDRILTPFAFAEPYFNPENYRDIIYRNPDAELISSIITGSTNTFNMTPVDPTDPVALASVVDVIVDKRTRNLALSDVDGIDLAIRHSVPLASGKLALGAEVTYLLDYDQQITSHGPVLSVFDKVLSPAALRGRAYMALNRGNWSGQLNINYVDSYENPFAAAPARVASWTTVDLNLGCDLGGLVGGAFANTRLSLSIQNVFDRDPPFVAVGEDGTTINDPVGFDPTNADPIGRFIGLQASKSW